MNNLIAMGLILLTSFFIIGLAYLVWVGIARLILYVLGAFGVVANVSPRLLGLLLMLLKSVFTSSKK